MSDSIDVQKSVDRMKIYMELRGLRPNAVYTFGQLREARLQLVQKSPLPKVPGAQSGPLGRGSPGAHGRAR
jgi:hypothetical protein